MSFTEPGQGIHRARLLGLARNDILLTLLAAIGASYAFQTTTVKAFAVLLVIGEAVHYILGVETALLRFLTRPV